MGINLGGNISQDDKDRVKGIRNPSAIDAGDSLGGSDTMDFFGDDAFDGLDDLFGGDEFSDGGGSADPFGGGSSGGQNPFGGNSSGGQNPFGLGGQSGPGGGLTGFGQSQVQQQPAKPDVFDIAFDKSVEGVSNTLQILIELIKSIRNRTADDLGYYSSNLIKSGLVGIVIGIVLSVVGALTSVEFISVGNFGGSLILGFALVGGTGMICIGIAAMAITGATSSNDSSDIRELPDVGDSFPDDATDEYEDAIGDIMADLFGDEDDEGLEDGFNIDIEDTPKQEVVIPDFGNTIKPIDLKEKIKEVPENRLLNRRVLVETFSEFLPLENPKFTERKQIDQGSEDFNNLEAICLKAMAEVLKCDMEEVKSSLESAYETFYAYDLRMKRVRGLKNVGALAVEIENYARDNPSDKSVACNIEISGDFYHIIITKGISAIVTMGDCFKQSKVKDFYLNDKNKLPIISGITELGEVIIDDAKNFDTMLIAGKPRSGKSWYVLSILLSLMLFNTPEDVQFIIVDPKKSYLFKTLAMMPHVAGIHDDEHILEIMEDIITNESEKRKKILADNKCDDIWALRKKGVKLPVLYLVIDEYITVRSNLEKQGKEKELDGNLQVLISQLPSQGIRLIFVPHRATGVVQKTNRTMLQFTAAVRANDADVEDTLDIKGWKRPLTSPGDIAIKSSSQQEAKYVRGAAITTSDEDNTELIEVIAKAFYKMGVDMPDMSAMSIAVNRDERQIRQQLIGDNRVQYNDEDEEDIIGQMFDDVDFSLKN